MSNTLVTGSAGFIGSVLVKQLREAGHAVIEIDQPQGDISLQETLHPYLDKKIDHIFHLAGKTFVPESWQHPYGFYQVNVLGTVNILELCRKTGARLTYVSSYLYGEPDYLPVDENHPLKSYNPYSNTKMMAESACRFYSDNFQVPSVILRPFNAYGPGQPDKFLIGEIISKVMDSTVDTVEVMDLQPKRDYVYVDDLVRALVRSMDAKQGVYNIGSGYSKSVEEIILLVMKSAGIRKDYRSKGVSRPNEIYDLFADIRKAETGLGWKPEVSFEEGIIRCIREYSFNR